MESGNIIFDSQIKALEDMEASVARMQQDERRVKKAQYALLAAIALNLLSALFNVYLAYWRLHP